MRLRHASGDSLTLSVAKLLLIVVAVSGVNTLSGVGVVIDWRHQRVRSTTIITTLGATRVVIIAISPIDGKTSIRIIPNDRSSVVISAINGSLKTANRVQGSFPSASRWVGPIRLRNWITRSVLGDYITKGSERRLDTCRNGRWLSLNHSQRWIGFAV